MEWMIAAEALWLILPAYLTNASAVVIGGGIPIDFGRTWRGRRIFGDGKTWRGFFGGIAAGMLTGILMNMVTPTFGKYPVSLFIIFSLSCGALLGDITISFVKRQIGKERGEKWILFDQLDFLIGAFVFSYFISIIVEKGDLSTQNWFSSSFGIWHIIFLLIFTPFIHYVTNVIGYSVRLKKVPW